MLKNLFCAVVAVETTITTLTIITEPENLVNINSLFSSLSLSKKTSSVI
ncbi:hypothetical protein HMPREF1332_01055 [Enterococcus faecalis ERV31]|nr:hypothetical protein HMPREF1332_01055 [Enterococcus faecalis ERV31]